MTDGKELARIPDQPTSASLAAFKAAGEAVVEAETIKAQIQRQVAGTKWGNAFSLRKQNAISEPCHETGASPVTDIDILGDRPYLNAHFWQEFVANQDEHVRSERIGSRPTMPTGRISGRREPARQRPGVRHGEHALHAVGVQGVPKRRADVQGTALARVHGDREGSQLGAFGFRGKEKRKAFQQEHGLPDSATEFRIADSRTNPSPGSRILIRPVVTVVPMP